MRPGMWLAVLVVWLAGCATRPVAYDVRPADSTNVGQDAADIARSRALHYGDDIAVLRAQVADLERQRADLLADAASYRGMAARTSADRTLRAVEREAYIAQYRTLACQRQEAAKRCSALMQEIEERIRILQDRRQDLIVSARGFERIRMASPR